MTEVPENATVLNSTVLSNFAHVNDVELLLSLPRPVTVEAVRTELTEGVETHPYLERALSVLDEDITVVTLAQPARELETELLEQLDPGEAQSLAVAEVSDGTIVTDDGDARRTANEQNVNLTDSAGLQRNKASASAHDSEAVHW